MADQITYRGKPVAVGGAATLIVIAVLTIPFLTGLALGLALS